MDITKVDLNLLKVVSAIAETGSVLAAANYLNVTQPAISNSLSRLRKLTGDKVFTRKQGTQQPTRFGRELVSVSNEVLNRVESCLRKQAVFDPSVMRRTFNLSLIDGLEAFLLPKILAHFQAYPNVSFKTFHCDDEDAAINIQLGKADIMLGLSQSKTDGVQSERIYEDTISVAVRHGHAYAKKKVLSQSDFDKLNYVIARTKGGGLYEAELLMRKRGVRRRIAYEAPDPISLASAVAETDYAAAVLQKVSKPIVDVFNLKTYPLPFELPAVGVFMSYAKEEREDTGVLWFKEELKLAFL